jgi:hypothetical protein
VFRELPEINLGLSIPGWMSLEEAEAAARDYRFIAVGLVLNQQPRESLMQGKAKALPNYVNSQKLLGQK